jgi:phosphatidylglycerophosphatase A
MREILRMDDETVVVDETLGKWIMSWVDRGKV